MDFWSCSKLNKGAGLCTLVSTSPWIWIIPGKGHEFEPRQFAHLKAIPRDGLSPELSTPNLPDNWRNASLGPARSPWGAHQSIYSIWCPSSPREENAARKEWSAVWNMSERLT